MSKADGWSASVERQNKAELLRIADKIDAGISLTDRERIFAASALRGMVLGKSVFLQQDRRGRRVKLPDGVWHDYLELQRRCSKNKAKRILIERYGVDNKTLRNYLGKYAREIEYGEKIYRDLIIAAKSGRPRKPRK